MNIGEVDKVKNHLYHLDRDVRQVAEFLRDVKEHIHDAVEYIGEGSSDTILSKDEAMCIINDVLSAMDQSRSTLERTSQKMVDINVAIADKVKPSDLNWSK